MSHNPLQSYSVEKSVIYSLFLKQSYLKYALPQLDVDCFSNPGAIELFNYINKAISKNSHQVNFTTTQGDPSLSKKAKTYIDILKNDYSLKNTEHSKLTLKANINYLKFFKNKRKLYTAGKNLLEELNSDNVTSEDDIKRLKANFQSELSAIDIGDRTSSTITLGKGSNLTEEYIREKIEESRGEILPTGFNALDSRIKGFRKGNVVLLTALRGEGKSLFAKSLSLKHFYDKRNVFIANLEMEEWEYLARLFSEHAGIEHSDIRAGYKTKNVIKKIVQANEEISRFGEKHNCKWTLKTIRSPNFTPQILHSMLMLQNYEVMVVDYINLFAAQNKDLWYSIYCSAQYVKMMAKELRMLVYLLGQLNNEGRAKYSSALEENADVWLWWKLEQGNPIVTIKHGKARDYQPFDFDLEFQGNKSRFVDVVRNQEEEETTENCSEIVTSEDGSEVKEVKKERVQNLAGEKKKPKRCIKDIDTTWDAE